MVLYMKDSNLVSFIGLYVLSFCWNSHIITTGSNTCLLIGKQSLRRASTTVGSEVTLQNNALMKLLKGSRATLSAKSILLSTVSIPVI